MDNKSKLHVFDSSSENAEILSHHAGHNSGLSNLMSHFLSQMTKASTVLALAVSFFGGMSVISNDQAHADLRICNKSESRVGISIGYRSDRGWTTEGWWNLEPSSCEVMLPGDLKSQFYYMFAVDYDEGGEWAGSAFMCTADKIYTIHGIEDCLARGFQRTGFFEIDTGTQTSWTIQLTEPTQRGTGGK